MFSLYARLAAPASPGTADLIRRAEPGPRVERSQRVQPGDLMNLHAAGADGALQELVADDKPGAPARGEGAERSDYTLDDLIEGPGSPAHLVPVPEARTNLQHWHDRPRPPAAPTGASLQYVNPLGQRIDTSEEVKESKAPRLAADLSGESAQLIPVDGDWHAIEPYDEPGVDLSLHRYAAHADRAELEAVHGNKALVVRAKTLRFTADGVSGRKTITLNGHTAALLFSFSGAEAKLSLVALVDAKSKAKLSYWDTRTDAVYATDAKVSGDVTEEAHRGTPDGYVAIEGHAPTLDIDHKEVFRAQQGGAQRALRA